MYKKIVIFIGLFSSMTAFAYGLNNGPKGVDARHNDAVLNAIEKFEQSNGTTASVIECDGDGMYPDRTYQWCSGALCVSINYSHLHEDSHMSSVTNCLFSTPSGLYCQALSPITDLERSFPDPDRIVCTLQTENKPGTDPGTPSEGAAVYKYSFKTGRFLKSAGNVHYSTGPLLQPGIHPAVNSLSHCRSGDPACYDLSTQVPPVR